MSDSSNRRRADRRIVVVPVQIDSSERKERLGVTRDVSHSGTLFLSNSKFAIGEKLQVTFFVSSESQTGHKTEGEVVRVEQLSSGLQWRYAMALRFNKPLPAADQEIAALEERD
ncbi:MAG: PilZ domain-containing protein [Myxococcales bacterium]